MVDNELSTISQRAARWFVKVKDGDMNHADRRSYAFWLKSSPRNIAEELRIGQIFGWLRIAKLQLPILSDDQPPKVVPLFQDDIEESPQQRRSRTGLWKVAAALSMVTLTAVILLMAKVAWMDQIIQTGMSEWRTQVLADGSRARLGPNTKLRLDYGKRRRSIHLLCGEAVFHVVKDAQRPFTVATDLALVHAVGTEFGVSRSHDTVIVTVSEGRVMISQSQREVHRGGVTGESMSIPVSAGEQVTLSGAWPVAATQVNVSKELAWAEGQLVLENTSVGDAIDEFNRRNRIQIEVGDPQIAARQIYGTFRAADPESFTEFLQTVAPVAIVRKKPDVLRIEAREDGRADHGVIELGAEGT